MNFFLAGADSPSPTEYQAGIPQALRLMNSPIANNPAVVRTLVGSAAKPAEAIEQLYLTALSRRPTADETKTLHRLRGEGQLADEPPTATSSGPC